MEVCAWLDEHHRACPSPPRTPIRSRALFLARRSRRRRLACTAFSRRRAACVSRRCALEVRELASSPHRNELTMSQRRHVLWPGLVGVHGRHEQRSDVCHARRLLRGARSSSMRASTGSRRVVQAGGNFIDTSNNYQDEESEEWIGEWITKKGALPLRSYEHAVASRAASRSLMTCDAHSQASATSSVSPQSSRAASSGPVTAPRLPSTFRATRSSRCASASRRRSRSFRRATLTFSGCTVRPFALCWSICASDGEM